MVIKELEEILPDDLKKVEKYTYLEYALLPEGAPYHLINGELIMTPAPGIFHQIILRNLGFRMFNYVENNKLGMILFAPVDVYLDKYNVLQPDIIFINSKRSNIIKKKFIEGAPDLIVEVLSQATSKSDLTRKKDLYEKYGVKEYWIIDPDISSIIIYNYKNNLYTPVDKKEKTGILNSTIITGFYVELSHIFKTENNPD